MKVKCNWTPKAEAAVANQTGSTYKCIQYINDTARMKCTCYSTLVLVSLPVKMLTLASLLFITLVANTQMDHPRRMIYKMDPVTHNRVSVIPDRNLGEELTGKPRVLPFVEGSSRDW